MLDAFLRSKGYEPKHTVVEYARGILPEGAVAGVSPLSVGLKNSPMRRFHFAKDFAERVERMAKFYNTTPENASDYILAHEHVHLFGKILSSYGVTDEKELETLLEEFYETVARQSPASNSTYSVERHDVAKRTHLNFKKLAEIPAHRKGIVDKLYAGKGQNLEEVVAELAEKGFSEKDISAIKEYLSAEESNNYNGESQMKDSHKTEENNGGAAPQDGAETSSGTSESPQSTGGEGPSGG